MAAEMELWARLVESGDCLASDLDLGTADGQVFLVHPRPSNIRFVVGRAVYRLAAEPIASGGQAAVYRATDPQGEVCAIKLAWPDQRGARLGQERDTLEQIHREDPHAHRWIVRVTDSGIAPDGRRFLAIAPWMDDTLLNWAWRRPPLPKLLHALEKAADALHDFHQAPDHRQVRVHRDIKPENLLIREVGDRLEVLLGDLGGARAERMLEQGSTLAVWTPKYAPPEQRLLLSRALDEDFQSMDIYALGVTMFYVLTWRYPDAAREDLLNERGQELNELYLRKATGLSAEEDARYESLRREDPENFLDLTTATLWSAQDDERLRRAFRERCRDEVAAHRAADGLADALKKAIRVDYRTRMKKVSNLAAALQRAREIVEAAGLPPANAEVPEPGAARLAVRVEAGRAVAKPAAVEEPAAPLAAVRPRPAPVGRGLDATAAAKPEPVRPEPPKFDPPKAVEAAKSPAVRAAPTPPKVEPRGASASGPSQREAPRAPEIRKVETTQAVDLRSEEVFPSLDQPGPRNDGRPAETRPVPRVAEARDAEARAKADPRWNTGSDARVPNDPRRTSEGRSDPALRRPPEARGSDRSDPALRRPPEARRPGGSEPRANDGRNAPDRSDPSLRPPLSRGSRAAPIRTSSRCRSAPAWVRRPSAEISDVTSEPTSESVPLTFDPFPEDTAPGARPPIPPAGLLSPAAPLGMETIVPDNMDEERPTTLGRPAPVRRATPALRSTPPAPAPARPPRPAVDPEATVLVRHGAVPSESDTRPIAVVALGVFLVMALAVMCGVGILAIYPGGVIPGEATTLAPTTPAVTPEATPAVGASAGTSAATPAPAGTGATGSSRPPTTSAGAATAPSSTAPSSTAPSSTAPSSTAPSSAAPSSSGGAPTTPAVAAPTTAPKTTADPAASTPKATTPATTTPAAPATTTTKARPPTTTATEPAKPADAKKVKISCCSGGEIITVGGQSLSCPATFDMAPKAQTVEWRVGGVRKSLTVNPTLGDYVCAADTGSGLKVYYGRDACIEVCQ